MKTTLLTICLLLFTSQVFAKDLSDYDNWLGGINAAEALDDGYSIFELQNHCSLHFRDRPYFWQPTRAKCYADVDKLLKSGGGGCLYSFGTRCVSKSYHDKLVRDSCAKQSKEAKSDFIGKKI